MIVIHLKTHMQKKTYMFVLALGLLLSSCGAKNAADPGAEQSQTGKQTEQSGQFSLKNALTLGQSLKCSYQETE
jgi:PBP1b-binding outer membrane lipoprotein LpoB